MDSQKIYCYHVKSIYRVGYGPVYDDGILIAVSPVVECFN